MSTISQSTSQSEMKSYITRGSRLLKDGTKKTYYYNKTCVFKEPQVRGPKVKESKLLLRKNLKALSNDNCTKILEFIATLN